LGCGSGEWLLELLEQHPGLRGYGVDLRPWPQAAVQAEKRGLADRATWVEADVATWRAGAFDIVVCVGASHAFGGLTETLAALRVHLKPGGQVLLGDAIWEQPPSAAAQEAMQAGPDDFPDLAAFVRTVEEQGFVVGYGYVSSLQDWDEYEWSWTGSLVRWALSSASTAADRSEALAAAHEHRLAWLSGYRRQLGFVTLVLTDVSEHSPEQAAT
jgi:SAM-dependent methyltransferase